jgi:hypothetical protein
MNNSLDFALIPITISPYIFKYRQVSQLPLSHLRIRVHPNERMRDAIIE